MLTATRQILQDQLRTTASSLMSSSGKISSIQEYLMAIQVSWGRLRNFISQPPNMVCVPSLQDKQGCQSYIMRDTAETDSSINDTAKASSCHWERRVKISSIIYVEIQSLPAISRPKRLPVRGNAIFKCI